MLPVWGAYISRGLYMEGLIFGILRYGIFHFEKLVALKWVLLISRSNFKCLIALQALPGFKQNIKHLKYQKLKA